MAGPVIFQNQPSASAGNWVNHDAICAAVRAWGARDGQLVVAHEIRMEWVRSGMTELDVPEDDEVWKVKLFRWLDNRDGSLGYRKKIESLSVVILAVLPLEFRNRLMPHDDALSRLAAAIKECAEAKQAVMLNAPEHQKLKEVSEGIASLFRLMPEQTGALMTIVSSMLGVL